MTALFSGQITPTERARLLGIWHDPARFAKRFLATHFWDAQRWMCDAVLHHPRSAVKACHASGKTHAIARLVLWFIARFPDGIAITTAPTWTQVKRTIWGHIHSAALASPLDFPLNDTDCTFGPDNYAIGLSTNEANRFQGFRGKRTFIAIDEGQGVRPPIFEAIEGIRAGGTVTVLMGGNPTVVGGDFHHAFTINRASWHSRTITAFDTPNLACLVPATLALSGDQHQADRQLVALLEALTPEHLAYNPYPYLTTRAWVLEKWLEWGESNSPLWDAKVMGRFPKQDPHSLLPLGLLEDAQHRELQATSTEPVEVGIDIAGPGEDETVLTVRRGADILAQHFWLDPDPRGAALAVLLDWRAKGPIGLVKCDSVGIGYYFALHLRDFGFPVALVNVGLPSREPERFHDLKSELFWALRERAERGSLAGLLDEQTLSQLTSIRYRHPGGRIKIESKDDMRKRGVLKSPDRAESVMLAFAPGFEDPAISVA